ncbi:MAG: protein phosphatase 2C domain-containing protein [Leptolyngbyaceae cyanobacterium]
MIKCPNPECQASNPEGNEQCATCQTFLPHRYLWVVGQKPKAAKLDKRYVWQQQKIVLDTEPGVPPISPDPLPHYIWPYLMLASHGLHVPQPYALLNNGTKHEILLLDTAAIAIEPGDTAPKLLPTLTEVWPKASPLRQLNWLWQIANLWSDFVEHQVASSLLLSESLRVHGSLVRLLELVADAQPPTLSDLGAFWQTLLPKAQPPIREFLEGLCTQLIQGDIRSADILSNSLDRAIATLADGYQVRYDLSVVTDQGPSRKRNEDACYPASGTSQTHSVGAKANARNRPPLLLLVCDGIGGHEGGDVASQLAIATIQQQLAPLLDQLTNQPAHDPAVVTLAIQKAVYGANDRISQHNDQGHRQARDRMGTTLVMALVIGIHMYVAHIGDSRAYRISSNSCRQVTFDDDVAAREVRLGYGFYADLVNRPGTGALIQALGMGHSSALHVVVQRLVLDEDIVLLLCSDGLSDYDRVEQYWPTHLLPILPSKLKPITAVKNLVQLANTYNGHDNVTVGVIAGRVQELKPPSVPVFSPAQLASHSTALHTQVADTPSQPASETMLVPEPVSKRTSPWPVLLGLVGILGTVTALTMVFFRNPPTALAPDSDPSIPETIQDRISQNTETVDITDDALSTPLLAPGNYIQLNQPVSLLTAPQVTGSDVSPLGQVPIGTTAQILTRQEPAADQSRWVKLKICEASPSETASPNTGFPDNLDPTVTTSESLPLTSGTEGWVLEATLAEVALAVEQPACQPE